MIENGVHIGRDGWLFLIGGSNDVGELFTNESSITEGDISAWNDLLSIRRHKIEGLGAKYMHFWVPDKLAVYREYVGDDLHLGKCSPAARFAQNRNLRNLEDILIDLLPSLQKGKAADLLYWKTDTHWSFAGAYAAYEAICSAVGASPLLDLKTRPLQEMELTLDLGSKINPIVTEKWSIANVLRNSAVSHKNALVRFIEVLAPRCQEEMHTGTSVIYENKSVSCDPRKVLIFGDSYCEYRPHSLAALLGETFRSVQFVWSSAIDYSLVEATKPDLVMTEMAERFMKRIPDDSYVLAIAAYSKIAAFLNRQCMTTTGPKFVWTDSSHVESPQHVN